MIKLEIKKRYAVTDKRDGSELVVKTHTKNSKVLVGWISKYDRYIQMNTFDWSEVNRLVNNGIWIIDKELDSNF